MRTIWRIWYTDAMAGRSPEVQCLIASEAEARCYAEDTDQHRPLQHRGTEWRPLPDGFVWGNWRIERLVVFETAEEVRETQVADERAAALAKLTARDRSVLGLAE